MTFRDDPDLEGWLAVLDAPGPQTITWEFPNDLLKAEYLDTIPRRSDAEVRRLLRHFLPEAGSFGIDEHRLETARFWIENAYLIEAAGLPTPTGFDSEYFRRLLDDSAPPPWPDLTWVLDLLPRKPGDAIDAIDSYLSAHLMVLPDGRIRGLVDAQAVIRAMWIANPASAGEKLAALEALSGEDFEHVVEYLYHARGWATSLTARSGDGGWDLEVSLDRPGSRERSIVECKRWKGHRVGVRIVRQLVGAWRPGGATKRILVTTSTFTRPARMEAAAQPQLELIDWAELLPLLDEHLGADWHHSLRWHIEQSRRRHRDQR
jgi:restriction system protein